VETELREVSLRIGGSTFEFIDNKLESICIHTIDLPVAHLRTGITFQSSREDIRKALGEPTRMRGNVFIYEGADGSSQEFQLANDPGSDQDEIIAITISRAP
jgi:hypothetical protein